MGLIRDVAGAALAGGMGGKKRTDQPEAVAGETPGAESMERAQEGDEQGAGFLGIAKRAGQGALRGFARREKRR